MSNEYDAPLNNVRFCAEKNLLPINLPYMFREKTPLFYWEILILLLWNVLGHMGKTALK